MAFDRNKTLQTAQRYVERRRFHRAIAEYKKLIEVQPGDLRTLLKIGDLQARVGAYPDAIATYHQVSEHYTAQGFLLKAVAVLKQIQELIEQYVPELTTSYSHIPGRLADIYARLGLVADAVGTYEVILQQYLQAGQPENAVKVLQRMVALEAANPIVHVRLAETLCHLQRVDEAIEPFWTAAQLLLQGARHEEALRVIERILHFRPEPRFAQVAAELHVQRGQPDAALRALAKLQICIQADPQHLPTLELLARAFRLIGQDAKAVEVTREMARIAMAQGDHARHEELSQSLYDAVLTISSVPPMSSARPPAGVAAPRTAVTAAARSLSQRPAAAVVTAARPPLPVLEVDSRAKPATEQAALRASSATRVDASVPAALGSLSGPSVEPVNPPASSPPAQTLPPASTPSVEIELVEVQEEDFESVEHERPAWAVASSDARHHFVEIENDEEVTDLDIIDFDTDSSRPVAPSVSAPHSAPRSEVADQIKKALVDADAYCSLRLFARAIEPLRAALALEPGSLEVQHKLHQVLIESGDEQGAQAEALTLAEGYLQLGAKTEAAGVLRRLLEQQPGHARATRLLEQCLEPPVVAIDGGTSTDAALTTQDTSASGLASSDSEPAKKREWRPKMTVRSSGETLAVPQPSALTAEAAVQLKEALAEVDFFIACGLLQDAKAVLEELGASYSGAPELTTRLGTIEQKTAAAQESGARAISQPPADSLNADLDEFLGELDASLAEAEAPTAEDGEVDVDEVFARFKEGVRQQIADTDSATHYDLGVAYKEMGLWEDAIQEFEMASRDPARTCNCRAMIGLLYFEQGQFERAASAYLSGLETDGKTRNQEASLYFDLGVAYEQAQRTDEALRYFREAARVLPNYRNVDHRVRVLEARLAG